MLRAAWALNAALCLAVSSAIAYPQKGESILVERGPSMANGACDLVHAALEINDLEYANSLIHNWLVSMTPAYPQIRARPEDLVPPEAAFHADIRTTASGFCDEIRAAFAANDPSKAYIAGTKLDKVLTQVTAKLPASPQAKFERMELAVSQLSGLPRFYRLTELAKAAFDAGDFAKAKMLGRDLLQTAAKYPDNWNHGNAVYFGYWSLGRVALHQPPRSVMSFVRRLAGRSQKSDTKLAGKYLLKAAAAPPGPAGTMRFFGPNTMLAKELLEKGQSQVVLRYFELCSIYWKMDNGKLAEWTAAVKRGEMPNFGANLRY